MAVLVKGALLVAAVLPHHNGCHKTYTVPMAQRAAIATYAGNHSVTRKQRQYLGWLERCQRNPQAKSFVGWFERHQRSRWYIRLHPPAPIVPPVSGLAACIISRESGGNPEAVNGQYTGEAQWSPSSWLGGGGGRFSRTPLGASKAQQTIVLVEMLAHGQAGQWTPYDGC